MTNLGSRDFEHVEDIELVVPSRKLFKTRFIEKKLPQRLLVTEHLLVIAHTRPLVAVCYAQAPERQSQTNMVLIIESP